MLDRKPHTLHSNRPICTGTLVAAEISCFVALSVLDPLGVIAWPDAIRRFGLSFDGLLRHGYLFQLVTGPLMHTDVIALVFDVLALWTLGSAIERTLGGHRYLILCGISTTVPSVAFLLLTWGSEARILGSSGLILGILAASAILFPAQTISFFGVFPVKMKYAVIVIATLTLYFTVSSAHGIGQLSPLFGALAAWMYLGARHG